MFGEAASHSFIVIKIPILRLICHLDKHGRARGVISLPPQENKTTAPHLAHVLRKRLP
jgi:hypothetical protein